MRQIVLLESMYLATVMVLMAVQKDHNQRFLMGPQSTIIGQVSLRVILSK